MRNLQKHIDDMIETKQLLIALLISSYHMIDDKEYYALKDLIYKSEARGRELRRQMRALKRAEKCEVKK
jgi:MFS superfamily sulfate permease-like transporter